MTSSKKWLKRRRKTGRPSFLSRNATPQIWRGEPAISRRDAVLGPAAGGPAEGSGRVCHRVASVRIANTSRRGGLHWLSGRRRAKLFAGRHAQRDGTTRKKTPATDELRRHQMHGHERSCGTARGS